MSASSGEPRSPAQNGSAVLRNHHEFFHQTGEPVLVADRKGRIVDANAAMESALGYGADGLIGVTLPELFIAPEDLERFRSELRQRQHVRDLPLRLKHRDGHEVELWFSVTARRDSRGRVIGYQGIARDVTEERRTIERLRRSEAYFRDLIEHSTDLITVLDYDGTIQYEGPSIERILGYTQDEMVGRNAFELVHPDDLPRVQAEYENLLRHPDRVVTIELRYRHKSGDWCWIESTGRILDREGQRLGIVVNSRDVTERRRAEERLLQAQKLEGIGRLAGGVAHDFNNMLTAILGNAQMLLSERAEDEPLVQDLNVIVEAAQRASLLTRQLMAFGRQQIVRTRPLDINDVVRRSVRLLKPLVGEARRLEVELAEKLPPVEADPSQLEQVLLNLVMNAVEATGSGGTVRVETSVRTAAEGAMNGSGTHAATVVLAVEDDGAGMSADVSAHAFEPFFTTKPQGSGLGLSTVYGIVRQAGGHIDLDSRPDGGTRVEVQLPLLAGGMGQDEPGAAQSRQATVLLVEDESSVRALARRILERAGHDVIEAEDGVAALELCEQPGFLERIDLLLTDVVMPRMDGSKLAGVLRRLRPDLPVLFMSGYSQSAGLDLPIGSRPGLVAKPYTPDVLTGAVDAALEAESRRDPSA